MKISYELLSHGREKEAITLLEAGLESHWGEYDKAFNPDINNLYQYYSGSMIVGLANNKVVCCGAWKPVTEHKVELVRVSVLQACQRSNIGTGLIAFIESHLSNIGIKEITLETSSTWEGVINFYKSNGYEITHLKDGDTYLLKLLE